MDDLASILVPIHAAEVEVVLAPVDVGEKNFFHSIYLLSPCRRTRVHCPVVVKAISSPTLTRNPVAPDTPHSIMHTELRTLLVT